MMFTLFLMILAFVGGTVLVYAVMEAPRHEYKRRLAKLNEREAELDAEEQKLATQRTKFVGQRQQLESSVVAFNSRVKAFNEKSGAFEKRIIQYEELQSENRVLKVELSNLHLHLSYQRLDKSQQGEHSAMALTERDRLASAYFDEVRALTVRDLAFSNHAAMKKRLQTAIDRVRSNRAPISEALTRQAFTDLDVQFQKILRTADEREKQAELRDKMREEARQEREAQAAQEAAEQAERKRREFQAELDRIQAEQGEKYLSQKAELEAKIRQLEADAEQKRQKAISMAQITKSGHIYVISNIGSFGLGVFKIGMTRRLEPLDRVKELGDASVPFPFDVHMLVACDNAPQLEKQLHSEFHLMRVNRANPRKEFFRVELAEIVKTVEKLHGRVDYQADAEALEYLQSEAVSNEELASEKRTYLEADDEDEPGNERG